MKAYKAFDKDLKCRGFQFEIGKEYKYEHEIKLCVSGFHACEKLSDCFNYYLFNSNPRIAEVEIIGDVLHDTDNNKLVTNHLKILRELSWNEILKLVNSGYGNSGYGNIGSWNSGYRNIGNYNSGNRNSGNRNSGNWNSGNCNSGEWNCGDCNSGNYNSGSWNSGDCNSGIFNTNLPDKIKVFNKYVSRKKCKLITFPDFLYFDLTVWVSHDTATDEEKKKFKTEIETCGGFRKTLEYKEAFKLSWDNADKENRMLIKKIPGFDKDLFFEISGIDVDAE